MLLAVDMAVHATVAHLPETADSPFFEILHAALMDFQMVEHFVIRFDKPVGKSGIYFIGYNFPSERFELCPLPVLESRDGNLDLLPG